MERFTHNLTKKAFCFFLLLLPIQLFGASILVISEDKPYQQKFIQHLRAANELAQQHLINEIHLKDLSKERVNTSQAQSIISLSQNISEKLIALKLNIPTLHTLSTRSNLSSIINCLPECKTQYPLDHFLLLDQPALRQLKLVSLIKPNSKKTSILYTDKSFSSIPLFQSETAAAKAINLQVYKTAADTLGFQLDEVARTSGIILAIADTDIFNTSTLPQILLTSYRHQTPVIGFSEGFVKAGAIAAVISDMPQIAKHSMQLIELSLQANSTIKSLSYPKYYRVISNRRVAKSLFLSFPNDDTLTSLLQTDETSP